MGVRCGAGAGRHDSLGTLWMINGFYDYFFHSDDAVAAKKGLQAAVSGGVMALMGGAFGTISLVY